MANKSRYQLNHITGCKVPEKRDYPNQWLDYWFKDNDLQYSHDGNHTIIDMKNKNKRRTINTKILMNYLITDGSHADQQKLDKTLLDAYISSWMYREEQKSRNIVLENIKYDEHEWGISNDIRDFVLALTGEHCPLGIAVIEQFVWLVKRKMKGLPVERHIFPILQGIQNSGKSTAVRLLLEPIQLFCSSRSVDMFNKENNLAVLTKKNVIWFDEMSKAKKADIDAVKLYTTSENVSYRVMYTQNEATARNVSTFIGCTNKSVEEIIYDPTGARRFYELKCQDKIDHELINKIDYLRLWRSIDESSSRAPINNMLKELEESQLNIKALDSVEEFFQEEQLFPIEGEEVIWVSFSELYQSYINWMSNQRRYSPFSKTKMGKRLTTLGIEDRKKNSTRLRCVNKSNSTGILPID